MIILKRKKIIIFSAINLLVVFTWITTVTAVELKYILPGSPPTDGNIAPPINSSNSIQQKSGGLRIGDGTGSGYYLCLNPSATITTGNIASDLNCIKDWAEVEARIISGKVSLYQLTPSPSTENAKTSSYGSIQPGHVRIKARGSENPSIPELAVATAIRTPLGASLGNPKTGIFSQAKGFPGDAAAVFSGNLLVGRSNGFNGEICLNRQSTALVAVSPCVSSWDQVTGKLYPHVERFTNPNIIGQQTANASILGVGDVGVILAGSQLGLDESMKDFTCGDGFCAPHENAGKCPIDCAAVNQLRSFSAAINQPTNNIRLSFRTAQQSPGGMAHVLITRSQSPDSTFRPKTGSRYQEGKIFADPSDPKKNTLILFARDTPQNRFITHPLIPSQDSMPHGDDYYYSAWQANTFPRYSEPIVNNVKFYQLVVDKVGEYDKLGVDDSSNGWGCDFTCQGVTVYISAGASVDPVYFTLPGYRVSFSGACSGTSCSFIMDSNKTMTINITRGGRGGGGL